jgi:hypothetical protein
MLGLGYSHETSRMTETGERFPHSPGGSQLQATKLANDSPLLWRGRSERFPCSSLATVSTAAAVTGGLPG